MKTRRVRNESPQADFLTLAERDGDRMQLSDRITAIKGIGEKIAENFGKLQIETVGDLICHYPSRYEVFEPPVPVGQLKGETEVAVEGVFSSSPAIVKRNGKTILTTRFKDPTGIVQVLWYNQPYLRNQIKPGLHYVLRGRLSRRNRQLTIEQAKLYTPQEYRRLMHVLQPVYALTSGITNNTISKAVEKALLDLNGEKDWLPRRLMKQYELQERMHAIREIHFPKSRELMLEARRRIVFDEFFLFTLALRRRKEHQAVRINQYPMERRAECLKFVTSLPYELTAAQRRVWEELQTDLTGIGVMNRLIQGDVGSGKTVLAELALMMCALNGYQACLMVPTEVLAKQHYQSIAAHLSEYGLKTELLTGSMTAAEKRKAQARIAAHEADIIIGTHALIQEKVQYDKLGLVVTDEQHRFGVKQRERLAEKGKEPHMLVMSATPIPRTLSILLYGDLNLSVLDELPANRLPIKNCVVGPEYRPTAYKFIDKQVRGGRQAYIICPMVEESEEIEAENVIDYAEQLREFFENARSTEKENGTRTEDGLTGLPTGGQEAGQAERSYSTVVEYLHGKMKPKEKNDVMERFASGEIQVLVSTTVVEVGVDVPNSTVMMIENAERFGLAQLHQLRGRVGRGKEQSYCIMVNTSEDPEVQARLDIMNHSNDGFYIASEDLKLRGPGDIFGIRQSGEAKFHVADIFQDAAILKQAAEAVDGLTEGEREELECLVPFEKFSTPA